VWTGQEDLRGKRLFVHFALPRSGFGETIQFCRFLKLTETAGAKSVLLVQPALQQLLRSLSPAAEMIAWGAVPEQFDFHIRLLSLPAIFVRDESRIPAPIPYLTAEPDRVRKWKSRLGGHGYRIGICWRGSKDRSVRAFPLALLRGIAAIPSVRLISLQKDFRVELPMDATAGMNLERLPDDFDSGPDAFLDTAAVMENLDLVISADTSVAHLAGALGRRTWLALSYFPNWRWLLERPDSPWYPTMRLFRQKSHGDWAGVFAEMESVLRTVVPVSDRHR
jgi:hypothetical protein